MNIQKTILSLCFSPRALRSFQPKGKTRKRDPVTKLNPISDRQRRRPPKEPSHNLCTLWAFFFVSSREKRFFSLVGDESIALCLVRGKVGSIIALWCVGVGLASVEKKTSFKLLMKLFLKLRISRLVGMAFRKNLLSILNREKAKKINWLKNMQIYILLFAIFHKKLCKITWKRCNTEKALLARWRYAFCLVGFS